MCFCASMFCNTLGRWRKLRKVDRLQRLKNILFIELSEMGSAVLAYPSIRYIQNRYPDANLYFLTFRQNRFSVDMLHVFPEENVMTIDPGSTVRFLFTTYRAFQAIRGAGIDTVFDLELFSRFSALITGFSGAERRVGYGKHQEEGLYRGNLMTHRVFYNCHQHMWKNFMALAKALEQTDDAPILKASISDEYLILPRFDASQQDRERLLERLAMINPSIRDAAYLVLMNPSGGSLLPIRGWPLENYQALGEKILTQVHAKIVLIGLEEADRESKQVCAKIGKEHCINFTGQTSFKDLMNLLSMADVLVTADSGPAHFASLTDIHNIVLFGPETPNLYRPLGKKVTALSADYACSPCLSAFNHRDTRCADAKCMAAVTVDEVFEAVLKAFEG